MRDRALLVGLLGVGALVLTDGQWRRLRWVALLLFALNYGWVVFAHTTLHWR